jgi:putative transposase
MSRLPEIANAKRKAYFSDLSDREWTEIKPLLEELLPKPKGFGHPRTVDLREILNGIFYVQRSGCQWEMMPHDLPPYSTVYSYFRKWVRKGIWQAIHDQLRHKVRQHMGRAEQSTVAIADSQSVKTTEKRGRCTALTGAKRLKDASVTSSSIRKACC